MWLCGVLVCCLLSQLCAVVQRLTSLLPLPPLPPPLLLLFLLLQDKVLDVQPETTLTDGGSASGGVVQLASGTTLPYDWLVVALGAAADPRGVPGIKDNARPFNSLSDAEFVAGRLAAFEARAALGANDGQQQQQATIVIVGAGYAGVELAAVVGERMRGKASVVVVTPGSSILESAPAGQRQAAEEVSVTVCC